MAEKKKGYALRAFKDAGTEEGWQAGEPVEVEAGAYANYEAAGLVGSEKPAAKDDDAAPKAATPPAQRA